VAEESTTTLNKKANAGSTSSRKDDRQSYKQLFKILLRIILLVAAIVLLPQIFGQVSSWFQPHSHVSGNQSARQETVTVTEEWYEVQIPRGTCVEANPIHNISFKKIRPDLTIIRSATGQPEEIFLTWKRPGTCS